MSRRSVSTVLAIVALLAATVACGSTKEDAAEAPRKEKTVSPGDFVDYEGPQTPDDTGCQVTVSWTRIV